MEEEIVNKTSSQLETGSRSAARAQSNLLLFPSRRPHIACPLRLDPIEIDYFLNVTDHQQNKLS
jgi:hypothetical protein